MDPNAALQGWLDAWESIIEHHMALTAWMANGGFRPSVGVRPIDEDDGPTVQGEVIGVTRSQIVVRLTPDEITVYEPHFSDSHGPHFINTKTYVPVVIEVLE